MAVTRFEQRADLKTPEVQARVLLRQVTELDHEARVVLLAHWRVLTAAARADRLVPEASNRWVLAISAELVALCRQIAAGLGESGA